MRSYARLDLALEPGAVLVVGPNGAGKTNLLESLHIGTQGFSPRARSDAQVIRFGAEAGRIRLRGARPGSPLEVEVDLSVREGRRARLNGVALRTAEQLRSELTTLVFTPDRLAIVKGGPAVRRAYFDRALTRLLPAQTQLPAEYGAVLAQRNAALRRVAAGHSSREALAPWTEQVATLGMQLVDARREVVTALAEGFRERAHELGLEAACCEYGGDFSGIGELESRLHLDLERGATGAGPHLHDVAVTARDRDLRSFGSQGEQRAAVLALLLAEASLVEERRGVAPLLLLDDVLSELDPLRRAALVEQIERYPQTMVTSTTADAYPTRPAQVVAVSPGRAEPA